MQRSGRRSSRLRRAELAALGLHLPALATICPSPLPPGPDWVEVTDRVGLDVLTTGAAVDAPDRWRAVHASRPHRPLLGHATDLSESAALADAGCRIIVGPIATPGAYGFTEEESVEAVGTDLDEVASRILSAARAGRAADLWVVPGDLSALDSAAAEAALALAVEGAVQARLWLAKEQFDRD